MRKSSIWPDATKRHGESEKEWLLRMLLQNLQALACETETLIRAYPPGIPVADELVNDFDSHLELVERDREAALLSAHDLDRVRAVWEKIHEMSGRHDPSLWTDEGLRTRPEWEEVRRLGRETLASIGYDLDPPPPWQERMRIAPAREKTTDTP